MRRLTNTTFFLAVLAINFTLFRPSPVDVLFVTALVLSLFSGQVVTRNMLILFGLVGAWTAGLYISSLPLTDDPEVTYYLVKITFAVSIGVCSCLVTARWTLPDLRRFFDVYIAAGLIAATLGIAGVLFGIEDLTWDNRAKGFLDDPNMYSAFLLPALFGCMYMLSRGRSRAVFGGALIWLVFGLSLAFSRAAIGAFAVWGGLYFVILNRRNLPRAALYAGGALLAVAIAVLLAGLFVDGLDDKILDRTTVAKSYDLGHGGRYNRYALAIPYILDNPLGLGLLTIDRVFDEPIHNILLSSFMNYGWLAGFAFVALLILSVAIAVANYKAVRDPVLLALFFCWLAVMSCAFLHEAERWRHLWLLTGVLWGVNARRLAARAPAGAADPGRVVPAAGGAPSLA